MTSAYTDVRAPVLVLGATGGQGGAVVRAGLERGLELRALVRRPASTPARRLGAEGVEVVPGDLLDPDALVVAMRGVRALFAVTTPFEDGPAAEVAQGRTVVDAAVEAGVPFVVFSSVGGADRHSGVPHFESKARIEAALADSGLAHTVLAPTYFFDNTLGGLEDLLAGSLPLPLPPDRPLQQLARADLGAVAARVLVDPHRHAGRRLELASDDPTPEAMSATLARVLGRPVTLQSVPVGQVGNDDMRAMWTFFATRGYGADIPALRAEFPDVAWTSFEVWAREALEDASDAVRQG